jgi:hypothetical protein
LGSNARQDNAKDPRKSRKNSADYRLQISRRNDSFPESTPPTGHYVAGVEVMTDVVPS